MSCRCVVRQCLAAMFAWLALTVPGLRAFGAEPSYELLPDSSNFVTASLLVISPTNEIYSVFGHAALRMECPTHNLDFVFSFDSDPSTSRFLTLFAGKAEARFVAAPTHLFLEDAAKEGRGVSQYKLNLTHHEKQQLWRLLDEDMAEGAHRHFNLLNNCVSMSVLKIHQCLIGEYLDWAPWQGEMLLNNGDLVKHYVGSSPWLEFLYMSFIGTGYGQYYDQECRLSPQNMVEVLSRASFVNVQTGEKRRVVDGAGRELLAEVKIEGCHVPTPVCAFAILLAVVLFITLSEWLLGWKRLARITDVLLLTFQSLLGLLLLYIALCSEVFGQFWNWYLIPFNLIPLALWLILRKRKNFGKVYLLYSVVLVAFIAVTPFVPQLDLAHQLIVATMLVRTISNYCKFKTQKK